MTKIATENPRISDVVKYEQAPEHGWCRDDVVINVAAAADYKIGTVLGKVTATGKYVPVNAAAVVGQEGAEVAAAILLENVSVAATTDTTATAAVNGAMIVRDGGLVFVNTHSTAERAAAVAAIEALGIKTRSGN
jgi:predicted regulator of Ras-like GTPase activity (Roadblock/LC7/MglB family)